MNVAKWVLCVLLAVPFLELAAFFAVTAAFGFGWALGLVLAGSLAGLLVLRRAALTMLHECESRWRRETSLPFMRQVPVA